jgi:hypothetical protein
MIRILNKYLLIEFPQNTVILFLLLSILYIHKPLQAQKIIWIESEDFNDRGGWTTDWQFMDQMGSPYLLSIGYGKPVEDASTKVNVKQPGYFRMWVRTLDWFTPQHPGQFNIAVNQHKAIKMFGKNGKNEWTWEDGGIFYLNDSVKVTIKDATGYYGRCDAIAFSNDTTWIPPVDNDDLMKLRIKYGSVSKKIENAGNYDVVVIGGGIAGTLAAVASAREGAKTALIQNRGQLGGNASHEIMVSPVGSRMTPLTENQKKYDPRETGLIEEIATYGPQRYFEAGKQFPDRLLRLTKSEPNLDLFLYTHATDVELHNNKIKSITTINVDSGKRLKFSGKLFIDCTGNGIIGVKVGAENSYGKESKTVYNETKAVNEPDSSTLGSSLKYWYLDEDQSQSFTVPSWAYHFPECTDFGVGRHPKLGVIDTQWMIELGGNDKTYANAESIRDDLLRLIFGVWDHIKNHCPELENESENKKLVWVSHVIGVRESYRLLGDYVLSELDVTNQILQEDRVAYGGWGLDEHPSEGFFNKKQLNNDTHNGILHSIPFRSLYSRNIDNLMMAGRDISATHVALTGTRVMYTCGVIGQAVGLAAGICIEKNTTPRNVYKLYIKELQQRLLKSGAYIIELPNMDSDDKALTANITASSELTPGSEVINGYARASLPTIYPNANMKYNAWIPDSTKTTEQWVQLNWKSPQKINVIHITFQNRGILAPKKFHLQQLIGKEWKTIKEIDNSEKFRRFVIPIEEINTNNLRIVLDENKASGGICEVRAYHEPKSCINMINRTNQLRKIPDGNILLPWEQDDLKKQ